jgi:hypothetical protein
VICANPSCGMPINASEPTNEVRGLGFMHTGCYADWLDHTYADAADDAVSANIDARRG